jgi:TRAP transporter TAXI family solute receptor
MKAKKGNATRIIVLSLMVLAVLTFGWQNKGEAKTIHLSVSGGGPGSSVYTFVGSLAEYVRTRSKIPNLSLTAQISQGFADNIRLVQRGETDMGMTGSADIYQSLRSLGKFKKEKRYTNLRGVFPGWWGKTHWCTYRKDLNTLDDIKGLHVNIGSPGSGTYSKAKITLRAAGLLDDVKLESQSWAEGVRLMQDGLVDAVSITMSTPAPAVIQAAAAPGKRLRFIKLGDEVLKNVFKEHPELSLTIIPADLYGKGIPEEDYKTCGYVSYVIAHKDVEEWAVYEMMKAFLSSEGKKFIKSATKSIDFSILPGIKVAEDIGMKLHPGAVRYWKEQGVKVPPAIIP